jgi:hypothetical protein
MVEESVARNLNFEKRAEGECSQRENRAHSMECHVGEARQQVVGQFPAQHAAPGCCQRPPSAQQITNKSILQWRSEPYTRTFPVRSLVFATPRVSIGSNLVVRATPGAKSRHRGKSGCMVKAKRCGWTEDGASQDGNLGEPFAIKGSAIDGLDSLVD